jgi:glutaredoxin 3
VNGDETPHIEVMSKVQIYTTGWCPYCFAAKALLDGKGVAYEEIDASDSAVRAEMIQRAHGRRTVPQIFIGDRHIGGYDDMAALERRGQLDPQLG